MSTKLLSAVIVLVLAILGVAIAILVLTVQGNNVPDNEDTPIVTTELGQVRGQIQMTLLEAKPFYSFRGIPYARPPLNDLRFKPPQPVDAWNGVLDAFEFGSSCIQQGVNGSENCLFVNVYSPNVSSAARLPVLITIHGGAFYAGSGNSDLPDFLLEQEDIVMVTFNYRLGPFGFLSLETPEYSGNMGLKDQLLAIKWTNENIHHFGGDRNRITIEGLSAGSVAAHMQVLSPAARGLFQRAILISGAANNPWAISHVSQLNGLYQFAANNGNPASNLNELTPFLQNVDANLLNSQTVGTLFVTGQSQKEWTLFYGPVVEPLGTLNPFFDRSPSEILEDPNFVNDVDTMFSVAFAESYLFIDAELRDPNLLASFNTQFDVQLPLYQMNINLDYNSDQYRAMANEIRTHYFGANGQVNGNSLYQYSVLMSDIGFAYGIDRAAKIHGRLSSGRTYYYRFSVDAGLNILRQQTIAPDLQLPGATHADEQFYTFGQAEDELYNSFGNTTLERRIIRDMSRFYTNFMVYGNPTPGDNPIYFEPVRATALNYVEISNIGYSLATDPHASNVAFWDNLFSENNLW